VITQGRGCNLSSRTGLDSAQKDAEHAPGTGRCPGWMNPSPHSEHASNFFVGVGAVAAFTKDGMTLGRLSMTLSNAIQRARTCHHST
jgi:hypothetical protein